MSPAKLAWKGLVLFGFPLWARREAPLLTGNEDRFAIRIYCAAYAESASPIGGRPACVTNWAVAAQRVRGSA